MSLPQAFEILKDECQMATNQEITRKNRGFLERLDKLEKQYTEMSKVYQKNKKGQGHSPEVPPD